jgi:hypothetical protein
MLKTRVSQAYIDSAMQNEVNKATDALENLRNQ